MVTQFKHNSRLKPEMSSFVRVYAVIDIWIKAALCHMMFDNDIAQR